MATETPAQTAPALTIGEFGRRCGLSGKALRLYDMSGLLRPAEVDPATGYRLYTESQLERARRISLLRQLDMPLAIVAEVLAGSDEQALRRLDRWWGTQEASIYHGSVLPDSEAPVEICVPFTGQVEPAGPIAIRLEPAHAQAFCTVNRAECYFPQIMVAYDAVTAWLAERELLPSAPPREVYIGDWDDFQDDDPFVHIAQPIERERHDG